MQFRVLILSKPDRGRRTNRFPLSIVRRADEIQGFASGVPFGLCAFPLPTKEILKGQPSLQIAFMAMGIILQLLWFRVVERMQLIVYLVHEVMKAF